MAEKGGHLINCHAVIELTQKFVQNTLKTALSEKSDENAIEIGVSEDFGQRRLKDNQDLVYFYQSCKTF